MGKHRQLPGGYTQTAELCDAEKEVNEALSLMQTIVNTVSLPAQALTLMLKVVFLLVRALASIHTARDIARSARGQAEEE